MMFDAAHGAAEHGADEQRRREHAARRAADKREPVERILNAASSTRFAR